MTFFNLFFEVQFIVSLIIAMLLFCMRCPKREKFWLRFIPLCVFVIVGSTLVWDWVKSEGVRNYINYWGIVLCNVYYIAELLAICLLCFKCKFTEACIYVIAGWVTQHLSGMISSVAARLSGVTVNYFDYTWEYFLITVLSYITVYLSVWLLFRTIAKDSVLITSKRIFVPSVIMLCVIILLNVFMPYGESLDSFLTMRFYSMACCVVMLFLIFATFREGGLKYDLNVIEQLERKRSEQYEMSRESIDIINNKCHDLKKLIGIITASKAHIPDAELEAINRELETYDAIVKTGNKAFDTIVTEKSLYCNGNGIKLSIVADVKSLDFIGDIDMYSLFGNILDNAIEATLKLDESRRSISVVVRDVKGFVSVHAENCYDGEELSFKNGIPQTTKKDASQHGFGVLSIRRIAKKYGGSISVAAEDGIFTVDVLIPISIGE